MRIRERLENRPAHRFEAGSRLFRFRRDVLTHRCDALSRPFGRHAAHIMCTPEADRRVQERRKGTPGAHVGVSLQWAVWSAARQAHLSRGMLLGLHATAAINLRARRFAKRDFAISTIFGLK